MSYTIINGDCLVEMAKMPDNTFDLIFCDLPYGTTACKWDTIIPFEPLWVQYKRLIKKNGAIVLFGSEPFASFLRLSNIAWYRYDWVWNKMAGANFFNLKNRPLKIHEILCVFAPTANFTFNPIKTLRSESSLRRCPIGTNTVLNRNTELKPSHYGNTKFKKSTYIFSSDGMKHPVDILLFSKGGRSKEFTNTHPTQKPVALAEYIIKTYTNEGDWVLDNCMGSGTTLVAAESLGRNSIGIELSAEYCAIAESRMRAASNYSGEATETTGQPTLTPVNTPQLPLAPLTLF